MDHQEVYERMAQARLRATLIDHIEAIERQPPKVGERVRTIYR
ncbi:hypothetical protein ACWEJ6_54125 [Nonomuraea sp. NPDC004702]